MSKASYYALGMLAFTTIALLILLGHEGGGDWAGIHEGNERSRCSGYVHQTLGTPAGQTHELYQNIHECVDKGLLPEDYKRRYQL